MNTSVFLLSHDFETKAQPDNGRYIGAYSTRERAEQAKLRTRMLLGFRDFPEGFIIDEYTIGEDHWTSGFSSFE
jgi:hypothetical protein